MALRSRAGHMSKTVQPCGWCFVSVGAMGLKGLVTSADATVAVQRFFVFSFK